MNNPIVGVPNYSTGVNGNPFYITVLFIAPNYALSPPIVSNAAGINLIETSIYNTANAVTSFTVAADISSFGNLPFEIKIYDTSKNIIFDQTIGSVVNLPPKNVIGTGVSTASGVERIIFTFEYEALNILDNVLSSFSGYLKNSFNKDVPKGYTDFITHIENAQNSLKSVIGK